MLSHESWTYMPSYANNKLNKLTIFREEATLALLIFMQVLYQVKLELEMFVFRREENQKTWRKTLSKMRTNNKLNPLSLWPHAGIEPRITAAP